MALDLAFYAFPNCIIHVLVSRLFAQSLQGLSRSLLTLQSCLLKCQPLVRHPRLAFFDSSSITPFLTKATWLAYVIPRATSTAHNL